MPEKPDSVTLCKTTRIGIIALPIVVAAVLSFMVADRWNLYGKIDILMDGVAALKENIAEHRGNAVGTRAIIDQLIKNQEQLRANKCAQRQCDQLERDIHELRDRGKR